MRKLFDYLVVFVNTIIVVTLVVPHLLYSHSFILLKRAWRRIQTDPRERDATLDAATCSIVDKDNAMCDFTVESLQRVLSRLVEEHPEAAHSTITVTVVDIANKKGSERGHMKQMRYSPSQSCVELGATKTTHCSLRAWDQSVHHENKKDL